MLDHRVLRSAVPVALLSLVPACFFPGESQPDTTTGTTATEQDPCTPGSDDEGVPLPPQGGAAPADSELVFAVSRWYLGPTTVGGTPSAAAWQDYGFNLDRTVTTTENECTCQPVAGAKLNAITDGPLGRDNGYGRGVAPILASLAMDFETRANEDAKAGDNSWLLRLQGVGVGVFHVGLTAQLYEAAQLTGPDGMPLTPAFDGTDVWPVSAGSLEDASLESAKLKFDNAYLVPGEGGGSLWVGRGKGTIQLRFGAIFDLRLVIHDPVVVLPISADRTKVERGMLGGTLDVEEIVPELGRIAGFVGTAYCPPNETVDSVVNLVRQAQDMVAGGFDESVECNRISLGIAFDALPAQLGEIVPAEPVEDPCAGM
jgi:hypothetical protein